MSRLAAAWEKRHAWPLTQNGGMMAPGNVSTIRYGRRCAVRRSATNTHKHPTAGDLDSQSVKTTQVPGERGADSGKRVKGRKRHLLVDTLGLLLRSAPRWMSIFRKLPIEDIACRVAGVDAAALMWGACWWLWWGCKWGGLSRGVVIQVDALQRGGFGNVRGPYILHRLAEGAIRDQIAGEQPLLVGALLLCPRLLLGVIRELALDRIRLHQLEGLADTRFQVLSASHRFSPLLTIAMVQWKHEQRIVMTRDPPLWSMHEVGFVLSLCIVP